MNTLFVGWQDAASRSWSAVGRLTRENKTYRFVYTRGAEKEPGFVPFGRMRDLHSAYTSDELFPLFANRVLAKSRPEHEMYLKWLGLDKGRYDVLEELSRTGGLRATDSVELFPRPERTEDNRYEVYFFTRGMRHMHTENQTRSRELTVGERLFLMPDVQNEFDPMALVLRTGDPITLVGYAPRYYSGEFSELIQSVGAEKTEVTVQAVNRDAPMQYRVLCRLSAPWPENFAPFSEDQYTTLA